MNTKCKTLALVTGWLILLVAIGCKKETIPGDGAPPPGHGGYLKIKVRAAVAVGQVLYDSVPAKFRLSSWDKHGVLYQKDTILPAGVSEVSVPASHTRFKIEMSKWGATSDTTLQRADIRESAIYTLVARKEPKLLKEEVNYSFVAGSFRPLTKFDFTYAAGKLTEIRFYQAAPEGGATPFQPIKKEMFSYKDGKVEKIKEAYLVDLGVQASERVFLYDANDKLVRTTVIYATDVFAYRNEYVPGASPMVNIFLEGLPNPAGTRYRLRFENDNRTEITTITKDGAYGYRYQFDLNINPYVHMHWPDTWFYRQSKNNIAAEKFFLEGRVSEDLKYEYTFDEEGYPVEVVQKERDPGTNNFAVKSKKVYRY